MRPFVHYPNYVHTTTCIWLQYFTVHYLSLSGEGGREGGRREGGREGGKERWRAREKCTVMRVAGELIMGPCVFLAVSEND